MSETSLETPVTQTPVSPSRLSILLLIAIPVVVVAIDQITKAVVIATLPEQQPVPVWPNVLILEFVRNPGAAFSLASGATWIFSILAVAVTVTIILLARRIQSVGWAVMLGLLLGGTLGNLADRLFRPPSFGMGWVIDFINLPWLMPAIFNIADVAITASVVVLGILVLTGRNLDGSKGSRGKK